jgi:hypothetical protein
MYQEQDFRCMFFFSLSNSSTPTLLSESSKTLNTVWFICSTFLTATPIAQFCCHQAVSLTHCLAQFCCHSLSCVTDSQFGSSVKKYDIPKLSEVINVLMWTITIYETPVLLPGAHRLNLELDLQGLFGLLCTAVLIGWDWDPATPPPLPPHLGSNMRVLLVSQDRRHLFVTPYNEPWAAKLVLQASTEQRDVGLGTNSTAPAHLALIVCLLPQLWDK